jgi:hypothetical protein
MDRGILRQACLPRDVSVLTVARFVKSRRSDGVAMARQSSRVGR